MHSKQNHPGHVGLLNTLPDYLWMNCWNRGRNNYSRGPGTYVWLGRH